MTKIKTIDLFAPLTAKERAEMEADNAADDPSAPCPQVVLDAIGVDQATVSSWFDKNGNLRKKRKKAQLAPTPDVRRAWLTKS